MLALLMKSEFGSRHGTRKPQSRRVLISEAHYTKTG